MLWTSSTWMSAMANSVHGTGETVTLAEALALVAVERDLNIYRVDVDPGLPGSRSPARAFVPVSVTVTAFIPVGSEIDDVLAVSSSGSFVLSLRNRMGEDLIGEAGDRSKVRGGVRLGQG